MNISRTISTNAFIKVFVAMLTAVCALAVVAVIIDLANGSDSGSGEVSWLYSQTADSAELDDLGGGRYHIILRDVDYHTIQFSDRPDRLVEVIDTADLVKNWDKLFATSSPNAVLVEHEPDGTSDSLVVVLEKPHFDYAADELTYEAQILSDEYHPERLKKLVNAYPNPPVTVRAVSLFIDSVTSVSTNNGPIFTGPIAEQLKSRLGLPAIPTEPLNLGSGVQILSANATTDSDGKIVADAVIGFNSGSFTLNMSLQVTDSKNWSLTTSSGVTVTWSPPTVPGLTIDPSSFSGSISSTNGTIAFNLVGATHSWSVATGATYISTPTFSSACPMQESKCPTSVQGPFIGMNGSLTITGFPNVIKMEGAMSTNAEWARFDGNAGNLTFAGTGVTNATLTMWRGARTDSFDPNMELPTLAKLTSGNNLEFCGGFSISIPKIVNKSTDGCVRWSPSGVVIGQVGVGADVTGSMPSTGGVATTSAQVKGLAFTNIASSALDNLPSRDVVMSGVATAIQDKKIVLAGQASLPGVVADALNISLGAAKSLVVDVRGEVSATGFSLSGDINTAIKIGSEPFKITVRKMTATISMEKGDGASFSVGTMGNATVGYSPNTRTLSTSIQLVASTSPQIGMSLSVNARGMPAAVDATNDGLTVSTRLTKPDAAQYVWPDQFGIKGLNLWNLTVQIAFQNGSPSLGYTSTTYIDPNGAQTKNVIKCSGTCDNSDWLIGTLGFNVSYTNPCFAYGFESSSGTSGLAIDGGVLKATSFKVGVAPAGCSIQSGSTQQKLPVAFVGFQFSASFGDSPGTQINVATQTSVDGFVFRGSATNLTLGGMKYSNLELNVTINDKGSDFFFNAAMTSGMGDMDVTSEFITNSNGMNQSLDASMTNWSWGKKGTATLKSFHFSTNADIPTGGCASFSASANGQLTVGSTNYNLIAANIAFDCHGVKNLYLKVNYSHKARWSNAINHAYLELQYPYKIKGKTYLYGDAGFSHVRHFSKKYKGKTFSRDVKVSFDLSLTIDTSDPTKSGFSFDGKFDADRVSGDVGCELEAGGGDFSCHGELRLNPSWAGIYHFDWDSM